MTRKMWALVSQKHDIVLQIEPSYWAIINSYNCRRASDFYASNPNLRIKRCTVTIP
jgi:hypothetical protein